MRSIDAYVRIDEVRRRGVGVEFSGLRHVSADYAWNVGAESLRETLDLSPIPVVPPASVAVVRDGNLNTVSWVHPPEQDPTAVAWEIQ